MKNLIFCLLAMFSFGFLACVDPVEPVPTPTPKAFMQAKINGQKDSLRDPNAKAYWSSGMLWVETNLGGHNIIFYIDDVKEVSSSSSSPDLHNMGTGNLSSANVIDLTSKNSYSSSISSTSGGSFSIFSFSLKDSLLNGSWSLTAENIDGSGGKFTAKEGAFTNIKISKTDKSKRAGEANGKMGALTYKFPIFEATAGSAGRISYSSVGPDIQRGYFVIDMKKDLATGSYKYDNGNNFTMIYHDHKGNIFDVISGDMLLIKNDVANKQIEMTLNGVLKDNKTGKTLDLIGFNSKFTYK
jgi:hypothetical protein